MFRYFLTTVCLGVCCATAVDASDAVEKLPIRVLYLGEDPQRLDDFKKFFQSHFVSATGMSHGDFEVANAKEFDVVVLDWSQSEATPRTAVSPLGEREQWSTPTVMLNSAGLLMAGVWEIAGGSG